MAQGEITLPKLFQTYRNDFGGTDESILRFVYKYLNEPQEMNLNTAIHAVCLNHSVYLRYEWQQQILFVLIVSYSRTDREANQLSFVIP